MTWWGLRQQTEKQEIEGKMRPSRAWPISSRPRAWPSDYVGVFAVTAGIGVDKKEKYFLDDLDDYSAIMLKALADRLAEAFAEALHERVRKDLWGYAPDESLSIEELIAEKYRGIRPAPGYPACPDHSVKREMFELLQARGDRHGADREPGDDAGRQRQRLLPRHPDSIYFNVGKIGEDQLQDQARRRGADVARSAAFCWRPICRMTLSGKCEGPGPGRYAGL